MGNNAWPVGKEWTGFGFSMPEIAGMCLLESHAVLDAIIERIPSQGCVCELGTYSASTAAAIAARRPDAQITCIDSFCRDSGTPLYPVAMLAIVNVLVRSNIMLYIGTTHEAARYFKKRQFDVVLVDGDHSRDGCLFDLELAKELLKDGGSILVHDYFPGWPGVVSASDSFATKYKYAILRLCESLITFKK